MGLLNSLINTVSHPLDSIHSAQRHLSQPFIQEERKAVIAAVGVVFPDFNKFVADKAAEAAGLKKQAELNAQIAQEALEAAQAEITAQETIAAYCDLLSAK